MRNCKSILECGSLLPLYATHKAQASLRTPKRKQACALQSGFTLVEVLVVTAISLLLMMAGTFIYLNCLKIYRESQELTEVMQVARLMDRDLGEALTYIVPLRGSWLTPRTISMPGQTDIQILVNPWGGGAASLIPMTISPYYARYAANAWANHSNGGWWNGYVDPNQFFSGPQDGNADYVGYLSWGGLRGVAGAAISAPFTWAWMTNAYNVYQQASFRDYCLPGFYGYRQANVAYNGGQGKVIDNYTNYVGSWGWPRPDYRLDADADLLAATPNLAPTAHGGNIACWFYAEDRYASNNYTMALDNNNIVLSSLKFTRLVNNGVELTQLSQLSHHILGFDHPNMGGTGLVRREITTGNMLRAVSITPYYMDSSGKLQIMTDNQLGCSLSGTTVDDKCVSLGTEFPRCFDVRYRLRGPVSGKTWNFALRVYCRGNSQ